MLRTTTLDHGDFFAPQYFSFGVSVICDVVLYALSVYGPLPAPADDGELSQFSALSALAALAASVPPFFFTSAELRMPVEGFARITGSCVAGVFERMTTVYFEGAETVIPVSRDAGLPFRFTSRWSDQATSADVIGVPSAKWTFRLSWKL